MRGACIVEAAVKWKALMQSSPAGAGGRLAGGAGIRVGESYSVSKHCQGVSQQAPCGHLLRPGHCQSISACQARCWRPVIPAHCGLLIGTDTTVCDCQLGAQHLRKDNRAVHELGGGCIREREMLSGSKKAKTGDRLGEASRQCDQVKVWLVQSIARQENLQLARPRIFNGCFDPRERWEYACFNPRESPPSYPPATQIPVRQGTNAG